MADVTLTYKGNTIFCEYIKNIFEIKNKIN